MSGFSASISASLMQAANATLEDLGFGPGNFSVAAYTGPSPDTAGLHCWPDAAFKAALEGIAGVTVVDDTTEPVDSLRVALGSATFGGDALPLTGTVTPGLYQDADGVLWWVIQSYDTTIYPDPTIIPALIRMAKVPGEILPWVQPLDQFDAYKLVNPFTGEPDRCTHNGAEWHVTQADGAGNNIWEPGVFGWTQEGAVPTPVDDGYPAWQPWTGINADLYQVGARVAHNGKSWESTTPNNHWEPSVYGWVVI